MFSYECDYSEENSLQKCKQEIANAPVIPRINACLPREGKQFGVCRRGVVLCNNRGNLSVADPRSRRRIARMFPARRELTVASLQPESPPLIANSIFRRLQRVPPGSCRQRENLDTKLIAFSMLALCKKTVERQTIEKSSANFC
jgi:hypothetical protein